MRCSICRTELVAGESFQTSDVMGGSYTTTKYTCPNHPQVFWNTHGEFYTSRDEGHYEEYKKLSFINNLKAAFGSFSRQLEVEIYKHDEDRWFKLPFKWQVCIYVTYTSNEEGDVLSRKKKIQFTHNGCYYHSSVLECIKGMAKATRWGFAVKFKGEHPPSWLAKSYFSLNIPKYNKKLGYPLLRKYGRWVARGVGFGELVDKETF